MVKKLKYVSIWSSWRGAWDYVVRTHEVRFFQAHVCLRVRMVGNLQSVEQASAVEIVEDVRVYIYTN